MNLLSDEIDFDFQPLQVSDAERKRIAEDLGDARWRTPPLRGPMMDAALLVLSGTVSISVLARKLVDLATRMQRPGVIVDARGERPHLVEVAALPGGTLVLVTRDGVSVHSVAGAGAEDAELLAAALRALPR